MGRAAEPLGSSQEGARVGQSRGTIRRTGRAWAAGAIALLVIAAPVSAWDGDGAPPASGTPARVPESSRPLGSARPGAGGSASVAAPSEAPGAGATALRTGLSLGAVLALLLGGAWVLKKLAGGSGTLLAAAGPGGRAPSGLLEVLGRYPLARGTTLMLLRVDRRVLLVSHSGGGVRAGSTVSTLCEITTPEEVASIVSKVRDADGESLAKKFAAVLGSAEKSTAAALERASPAEPPPRPSPTGPVRRREVVSSAGDRAELWDVPSRPKQAFVPLPTPAFSPPLRAVPAPTSAGQDDTGPESSAIDAAAETLRRRLGALRARPENREGDAA